MIYSSTSEIIPHIREVGGKGKALIETSLAGFPVPEAVVLSTEFLDPWIKEIKNSPEWQTIIEDPSLSNCNKVQKKAKSLTFTTSMQQELKPHIHDNNIFAVRSSSPEEDLESTSFAGMYETLLGVTSPNLENAAAQIFASCFDYRVMTYKKQHNINLNNTCIAIIIQKQIKSDVSGIAFSLNPLNNCYDEVFINSSFGLGEAIVSGIVTPDQYIYDYSTQTIIEKKINKKETALHLKDKGGIEEKQNANPETSSLTDPQIIELSNLIKKCESYYNYPIDTEWAYENNKLYLLQARPITTYLPFFEELLTKPGEKKKFYMDIMIMTQGFDEPMSVLGLDIWSYIIKDIKGGMLTPYINGTAPAIHGRQYMNFTGVQKLLGKRNIQKLFSSYDKNIENILKDINLAVHFPDKKPEGTENFGWNMTKFILTMIPDALQSIFLDYRFVIKKYLKKTEKTINKVDMFNQDMAFEDIVYQGKELLVMTMDSIGMIIAGMMSHFFLINIFKGEDIEKEVIALSMDLQGNPTSEMGHLLFKIASYSEFQDTTGREEFIQRINSKNYSDAFLKDYQQFMLKYSCRGIKEIDVASKRIYEDIGMLYDKLIEINIHDNQILSVQEKRQKAYDKLLEKSKLKGKEKQFIKFAERYQATFGYREHPKYLIVYIISAIHKICLEIAEDWVQKKRLDEPYQIFDLSIADIQEAQKDISLDLHKIRDKNLEGYRKVEHIHEWPLVIDSRGKIYKPKIEIRNGDMIGQAIAPGKIVGKAKVLRKPYEKPLHPGEILIARATEPSWTPIFINAAGVIMEIGGPLQHGGIIAREYGIPCVSGLIGIMDIIKDGDLIEVDGYNGIVRILTTSEQNI